MLTAPWVRAQQVRTQDKSVHTEDVGCSCCWPRSNWNGMHFLGECRTVDGTVASSGDTKLHWGGVAGESSQRIQGKQDTQSRERVLKIPTINKMKPMKNKPPPQTRHKQTVSPNTVEAFNGGYNKSSQGKRGTLGLLGSWNTQTAPLTTKLL